MKAAGFKRLHVNAQSTRIAFFSFEYYVILAREGCIFSNFGEILDLERGHMA